MCVNARIMTPLEEVQKDYGLKLPDDFRYVGYGEYKVAFTHPFMPIILENREVALAKWGLIPTWVRECKKSEDIVKFTVNAKFETMASVAEFKGSVDKGRAIAIIDGYYEWKTVNGNKTAYYISAESGKSLLVAVLVSPWNGLNTFSIVTTEDIGWGRMPFFLDKSNMDSWLDSKISFEMLQPNLESKNEHLITIEREPIF